MTPAVAPPEWFSTVAAAASQWPGAAASELSAWLWSRPELSLRLLADALDEQLGSRGERP